MKNFHSIAFVFGFSFHALSAWHSNAASITERILGMNESLRKEQCDIKIPVLRNAPELRNFDSGANVHPSHLTDFALQQTMRAIYLSTGSSKLARNEVSVALAKSGCRQGIADAIPLRNFISDSFLVSSNLPSVRINADRGRASILHLRNVATGWENASQTEVCRNAIDFSSRLCKKEFTPEVAFQEWLRKQPLVDPKVSNPSGPIGVCLAVQPCRDMVIATATLMFQAHTDYQQDQAHRDFQIKVLKSDLAASQSRVRDLERELGRMPEPTDAEVNELRSAAETERDTDDDEKRKEAIKTIVNFDKNRNKIRGEIAQEKAKQKNTKQLLNALGVKVKGTNSDGSPASQPERTAPNPPENNAPNIDIELLRDFFMNEIWPNILKTNRRQIDACHGQIVDPTKGRAAEQFSTSLQKCDYSSLNDNLGKLYIKYAGNEETSRPILRGSPRLSSNFWHEFPSCLPADLRDIRLTPSECREAQEARCKNEGYDGGCQEMCIDLSVGREEIACGSLAKHLTQPIDQDPLQKFFDCGTDLECLGEASSPDIGSLKAAINALGSQRRSSILTDIQNADPCKKPKSQECFHANITSFQRKYLFFTKDAPYWRIK